MNSEIKNRAFRACCVGIFVVFAARIAWIADDSLITLRSVLNISEGWGFGFNVFENVQAYTHPLWMLLWTILGVASGSWAYSIIGLSLMLSGLILWLLLRMSRDLSVTLLVTTLALLSTAFLEFSTSGLENPLGGLLLLLLFVGLARDTQPSGIHLGLLTGAILLTRLDYALLAGPAIAFTFFRGRDHARWMGTFLAGFAPPIALWYAWSYVVYGTPLPSTYYAKTNVEIALSEQIQQGLHYLSLSLRTDLSTLLVVVFGLGIGLLGRSGMKRAWSIGVIAYLAYVVTNGGDFMVGRFLYVPFTLCLAVLISVIDTGPERIALFRIVTQKGLPTLAAATLAIVVVSVPAVMRPSAIRTQLSVERWSYGDAFGRGVADERAHSAVRGTVLFPGRSVAEFADSFRSLRQIEDLADAWGNSMPGPDPSEVRVACGRLGAKGLLSGPSVHMIDACGLADIFVASLRYVPPEGGWRVGHYYREIPEGYVEAVSLNDPSRLVDPMLERRLRDIWRRNRHWVPN